MTDSKTYLLDQLQAGASGVELPGPGQQEEQAPWMADQAFFDALVPAAQQDLLAGADMSAEWAHWSGLVATGGQDTEYEVEDYEPPMTADEQAEQVRIWTEIGQQGGTSEVSAEEALSYADQWAYSARAAALGEYRAGRRRDLDLHPDDLNAAVQAEVDARVEAGRQKWGRDR